MKKLKILLIFSIVVYFNSTINAKEGAIVYCDKQSISQGSELKLAVHMKNNKGLMGFKISATYNPEEVTISSVERGNVTKQGNFNDNIKKAGTFDVVWSNTENVVSDGVLFYLTLNASKNLQGDVIIQLSYSKGDTFNEKWEDVILKCQDIKINFNGVKNDDYTQMGSETKDIYEEFIESVLCNYDDSQIITIIDESLNENDVTDLSEADEKTSKSIYNKLKINGKRIIKKCTLKKQIEVLNKLYKEADQNIKDETLNKSKSINIKEALKNSHHENSIDTKEKIENKKYKSYFIIIMGGIVISTIAVVIFLRYKRKGMVK